MFYNYVSNIAQNNLKTKDLDFVYPKLKINWVSYILSMLQDVSDLKL